MFKIGHQFFICHPAKVKNTGASGSDFKQNNFYGIVGWLIIL